MTMNIATEGIDRIVKSIDRLKESITDQLQRLIRVLNGEKIIR